AALGERRPDRPSRNHWSAVMRPWASLSATEKAEAIKEAKRLIGIGKTWREVGRRLDLCHVNLWNQVNPDKARAARRSTYTGDRDLAASDPETARRMAEIPEDTRSLAGRIFNDPLPGRSA